MAQAKRDIFTDDVLPKYENLLELKNLTVHFHTQDGIVKAVDGISFVLNAGETLGIVGESGSGKSVTALSILGLVQIPPGRIEDGDILFKGQSLIGMKDNDLQIIRGNHIAMIFQDPLSALNPVYRVGQQVGEGLVVHRGLTKAAALEKAVELLDMVGIPNPDQRVLDYPHQFSGGMRQRAMIAMALACDPEILIADEPTTALDVTIQAQIIELMQRMQEEHGTAIIMITHDLGVVADMADRIIVMYAGKPVEYGTADQIFYQPLHPYSWGLMRSIPKRSLDSGQELTPIKGNPPSLINLPPGCAFSERCPYASPRCASEQPKLRMIKDGHYSACFFSQDEEFLLNSPIYDDQSQPDKGDTDNASSDGMKNPDALGPGGNDD
ncbi:MAG: ABC transporter ATP-binding protein [Coriobacteriia bacterium]|nr:ABC transporter ATP-binding protein [Coriobacteriia bacterium]